MADYRYEHLSCNKMDIAMRPSKPLRIRSCAWIPPEPPYIRIKCDGASTGNPGPEGYGVVYRYSNADCILTVAKSIGHATNFIAECLAILEGVEIAIERGWYLLWVKTDYPASTTDNSRGGGEHVVPEP